GDWGIRRGAGFPAWQASWGRIMIVLPPAGQKAQGFEMRNRFTQAFAGALAAAFVFVAQAQQPQQATASKTLKMQSTWPASLTLQDNFRYFAERVDKLTSGQLKIEALAAGQIVPPFEVLDATH